MPLYKAKNIRKANQLNQKDVAKILGISRSTYALFETEDKIFPLEKIRNLCNYFQVSMDYLFNLEQINNYKYLNNLDRKLIGKNITLVRKKYNLSQIELAKILNTTQSTISAYENGKTLILTAFLYQLCKHFHLSMDEMCNKKTNLEN